MTEKMENESATSNYPKNITLGILYILTALVLSGCVCAGSNTTYGPKGKPIGNATISQIKPGETTKAWVLSLLGDPSSVREMPDGTEVLKYEYNKQRDGKFVLFPIIFLNDSKVQKTACYVEIKHGIVTKRWIDRD
jgi:outer membrane protein assembly factor BamE (lipoprotein component of BamABCDE complex)